MKTAFLMAMLATLCLALESCSAFEKNDVIKTWFWTRKYNAETQLIAQINDSIQCEILYSNEPLGHNDIHMFGDVKSAMLVKGAHNIVVKTNKGKAIAKGILTLEEGNMTLKGISGGLDARQNEDNLLIEVL